MAASRTSPDQYLQQVGRTWYARVRVPPSLQKHVGQTHIRRSLKTGDKATANRLKHAAVGHIKGELERLRRNPVPAADPGLSFTAAKQWRDSLKAAELKEDEEQADIIRELIHDKAAVHERLHGSAAAVRWHRIASTTSDTLNDLMNQWLGVSEYKASTNAGHRKALSEVLAFMGNPEAVPSDVTLKTALSFIDTDLTQRGLAHATIGDRLVSLGGFWRWMGSRGTVADKFNPWAGHRISRAKNKGRSPPKRSYTDAELLKLLAGTEQTRSWPTYGYLPDLLILGMFTGARIDELCSLTGDTVVRSGAHYVLSIADSKTKAGIRSIVATHPAPVAVLKRRLRGLTGAAQLFPELSPGGLDDKLSSSAVKAYGRYRRTCGVPDGTDFHSYRRNVITVLEAARVDQVRIARFVGHEVGTLAADDYSAGGNVVNARATAKKVRYRAAVEAAALALAQR
jgi:integrase